MRSKSPTKNATANVTDPISAMLKIKAGLAYLNHDKKPLKIMFAPDAIRDITLQIDDPERFTTEVLGKDSKNRTSGQGSSGGGGHALHGAVPLAISLGDGGPNVEIKIAAKVFDNTRPEVIGMHINHKVSAKHGHPINTDFILFDPRPVTPVNVVFETPKRTNIVVTAGQPVLRLDDYGPQLEQFIKEMADSDVLGILSLKSPFMADMVRMLRERNLKPAELVSDVTTGDDTAVMVDTLKFMGHGAKDALPSMITLLSMNDEEALRYAKIVWGLQNEKEKFDVFLGPEGNPEAGKKEYVDAKEELANCKKQLEQLEAQGGTMKDALRELRGKIRQCEDTIRACSKNFESGIAVKMAKKWEKDPFEAASFLSRNLSVPLFFHCAQGSKIFDPHGHRSTQFVSSINLKPNAGTVGAGDTMIGAMMLAIGIKNRLDASGAPEHMRLSYEDCLMYANISTGCRLAHGKDLRSIQEYYEWISSPSAMATPPLEGWKNLRGLGKTAHSDALLVQEMLKLLQEARNSGFSGENMEAALKKVSPHLIGLFQQEEICKSPNTDDAVRMLLSAASGYDKIASSLAIDSLLAMAKSAPGIKGIIRRELGIGDKRLVAMFDLDSTLFDSKSARERAGARAIMSMQLKTRDGKYLDFESAKKLFKTLYSRHDEFKAMGLPDFRQVWNTPQMYAAAAAIVRAGGPGANPVKDKQSLLDLLKSFESIGSGRLSNDGYFQLLANTITKVMNGGNYTLRINRAMQNYLDTGFVPYPGARRALSVLKDLIGVDPYVVTEGHDKTQRAKIQMLGLADFFGPDGERVITTDYAHAPWREAAGLESERVRLASQRISVLESHVKALEVLLNAFSDYGSVSKQASDAKRMVEKTKRDLMTHNEETAVFEWVMSIFERKADKGPGNGAFFSEVLRAINEQPDNPREALGAGSHGGWNPSSYLGFVVGDRISTDIAPMLQVSKDVVPILMMTGPYSEKSKAALESLERFKGLFEDDNDVGDESIKPFKDVLDRIISVSGLKTPEDYEAIMPKLVSSNLSDVALLFLSKATYSGVNPVSQPMKVRMESFSEDVIDKVLLGRVSNNTAVKLVCEDVLKTIASGSDADICGSVSHLVSHLDSEHTIKNHYNRKNELKVSAAESLAMLFENCPNPSPALADSWRKSAERIAEEFSNQELDPSTRASLVSAYGRISENVAPIDALLRENPMDLNQNLVAALEATSMKMHAAANLKGEVKSAYSHTLEISMRMQEAFANSGNSHVLYRDAVKRIIADIKARGDPVNFHIKGEPSIVLALYKQALRSGVLKH